MARVVRAARKGAGIDFLGIRANFHRHCILQRSFFRGLLPDEESLEIEAVLNLPLEKERAGNLYNFLEQLKGIFLEKHSNFSSPLKCEELTEESLQLLSNHPLLNRENTQKRREEIEKECETVSLDIEKSAKDFLKPLKEGSEKDIPILSMREIALMDSLAPQKSLVKVLGKCVEDIKNIQLFQDTSERDFSYASLLKVSLSIRRLLASDVL